MRTLPNDESDDEDDSAHVALVVRDTLPEDAVMAASDAKTPVVWAEAHMADEVVPVSVTPVVIDNETVTTSSETVSLPIAEDLVCHHHDPEVLPPASPPVVHLDGGEPQVTMVPESTICSLYRWNFIVFVVGNAFLFAATASTVALEIGAGTLYLLGVLFHWIAEGFAKAGNLTILFQTIFRLLSVLMLSIDLILLTISSLLSEVLAWIAGILCTVFGGINVGLRMHKHIGRLCQWTRTGFRSFHAGWHPERMEPDILRVVEED